jgi:hypothetical protein
MCSRSVVAVAAVLVALRFLLAVVVLVAKFSKRFT